MPGSKYIILVVLLINERNKERKKERGRERGRKRKRRGRREKSEKEKINGMRIPWHASG